MLPVMLMAAAYLIGSIPFSYLVARSAAGADIREQGSGNVGATNVLRTAGKRAGAAALFLDAAKGYGVVLMARWMVARPEWPFALPTGSPLHSNEMWIALAVLIAVLGHMFPVWLGFRGGKGVATVTGAFLALDAVVVVAAAIIFAIVFVATRYVSLASIVSAASAPLLMRYLMTDAPFWRIIISIVIVLSVIAKHHSNIARLARGEEQKFGQPKDRS